MPERPHVPQVYRTRLVTHETFADLVGAREFMREHFRDRLTLEIAAREAYLSPYHFHRTFSAAFGETPHEFLTRIRLNHAKSLLRKSDLTVSDICVELGYESLGSFSTLFAKHEGYCPTEFRRVFAMPQVWVLKAMPACFRY